MVHSRLKVRHLFLITVLVGMFTVACGGSAPSAAPAITATSVPPTPVVVTVTRAPLKPAPSPSPSPTPTVISARALVPGRSTFKVEQLIEGVVVSRNFIIHAPARVDPNRSYPIVMAFHGYGGWAGEFEVLLSRFVEAGDFIGIYPMGSGPVPAWNVGNGVSSVDDLEFVGKIIDLLADYEQLDLSRTYAIGISMGAGFVQILAGQTDYFSSAAAIVTQLQIGWEPQADIPPVSILQISGMNDSTIPYDGGKTSVGNFYSAEESARIWAVHNSCDEKPTVTSTQEGNRKLVYSGCLNGTQVVHYGIANGRHSLPAETEGGLYDLVWSFLGESASGVEE